MIMKYYQFKSNVGFYCWVSSMQNQSKNTHMYIACIAMKSHDKTIKKCKLKQTKKQKASNRHFQKFPFPTTNRNVFREKTFSETQANKIKENNAFKQPQRIDVIVFNSQTRMHSKQNQQQRQTKSKHQ